MKSRIRTLFFALVVFFGFACLANAAITFTITPSAISNTYDGIITLQINGLTNTETVVVQKFLDLNTNGVVDARDYLVQQFNLTDGQMGMVISGVTNFNVPGDTDGTANGQITATLNFQNGDFAQNIIGQYIFVLSSPVGHFGPITNLFNDTNFPYAQKITGNVINNGTNVPNAVVLLSPPPSSGNNGPGTPVAGAVANNSGVYTIQAPPGVYVPFAISSYFVVNYSISQVVTLGSGATVNTNLSLTNATQTISGHFVDATHSGIGLPGVFLPADLSTNGQDLIAVCFSDTTGNFTERVSSGQWGLGSSDSGLIVHGYVGWNNSTNVNAGATGVTLAYPKATALFYGKVTNNLGSPLANIDIGADDNNNNLYEADAFTETNGSYVLGVLGGLGSSDPWQAQYNGNPTYYIFSQPALDQNGGTNIGAGKAVLANFTGILATNTISGNVETNGNPIIGVGVSASATIGGTYYNLNNVDTDTNGDYTLSVANGTWSVNVSCQGGNNDSLDNILGNGNYQCPDSQNVTINNNNATGVNFVVQLSGSDQIFGYLTDGNGNPIIGVNVYANDDLGEIYTNSTDDTGYYSFNVSDGNWDISVDCSQLNGQGYLCVSDQNVYASGGNAVEVDFAAESNESLQISTLSLTNSVVGLSYSEQLQASGSNPPFSWSLTPGSESLPSGLTLTSGGLISGVPNVSGTFYFSVRATDSTLIYTDQPLSIIVLPPALAAFVPNSLHMLNNRVFQFQVSGPNGYYYIIETSTNLTDWTLLSSTSVFTNLFTITDNSASNSPTRFYRVALGPEVLDTTNQVIFAAEGGTVTLASGGSASIPGGVLSNDVVATLSLLSDPGFTSPNGLITSRGPAMLLDVEPLNDATNASLARPLTPSPNQSDDFVINFSGSTIAGTAPFVQIDAPSEPESVVCNYLTWALQPQPNGSVVIPGSLLSTAFGSAYNSVVSGPFVFVAYAADVSASLSSRPLPQLLLWNGGWTTDLSTFNPTKRTLLFVHGMLSSVETAFPDPTSIMEAGGYCQAIGFDYDWTLGINANGLALASLLNRGQQQGLSSVDIEAHSEGVAVALSAAHYTSFPIMNMVLLGGPILGTPLANSGATLANILQYLPVPAQAPLNGHHLGDIENGQFVSDLQANSSTMEAIVGSLNNNPNRVQTKMIQVAGENPQLLPAEQECVWTTIFGSAINDGVIPESSALGGGFANATLYSSSAANHIELESNPDVLNFVGSQVSNGNKAIFSVSTNQLYFDCESLPNLIIANTNSGCLDATYTINNNIPWLTVNQLSDTLQPGQADQMLLSTTTANLSPGTYQGTFTIMNPAVPTNSQNVAVTLVVPNITFSVSQNSLSFMDTTTSCVPCQTFVISNTTSICGTLDYVVSNTVPWLTISNAQGYLCPGSAATISVCVTDVDLYAGATYKGAVVISDVNNLNNSVTIPVTLVIANAKFIIYTYAPPTNGCSASASIGDPILGGYYTSTPRGFFPSSFTGTEEASGTASSGYYVDLSCYVTYQFNPTELNTEGNCQFTGYGYAFPPSEDSALIFVYNVSHLTHCQITATLSCSSLDNDFSPNVAYIGEMYQNPQKMEEFFNTLNENGSSSGTFCIPASTGGYATSYGFSIVCGCDEGGQSSFQLDFKLLPAQP